MGPVDELAEKLTKLPGELTKRWEGLSADLSRRWNLALEEARKGSSSSSVRKSPRQKLQRRTKRSQSPVKTKKLEPMRSQRRSPGGSHQGGQHGSSGPAQPKPSAVVPHSYAESSDEFDALQKSLGPVRTKPMAGGASQLRGRLSGSSQSGGKPKSFPSIPRPFEQSKDWLPEADEGGRATPLPPPPREVAEGDVWEQFQVPTPVRKQAIEAVTGSSAGPPRQSGVPPDKEELGRATWTFLHTLAAQFPERPTRQQQRDVKELMYILTRLYPCKICADHFKEVLRSNPPVVSSGPELAQWMCRIHNVVNRSLDKPQFPCQRVNARWGALACGQDSCTMEDHEVPA